MFIATGSVKYEHLDYFFYCYEFVLSQIGILTYCFASTVLQEVEAKIEGFRKHLKLKLAELPSPLEDQKKLIR